MFDSLSLKLEKAFQTLKGQGRITEINVASTIKEIRKALIDADVNYKVAKDVTDDIKEKAMGQNVLTSVSPGQLMVKIVSDELTQLMGGTAAEININDLVSVKKQQAILDAIAIHGSLSHKTLIDNLPDDISYGEIRMVLAVGKTVTEQ